MSKSTDISSYKLVRFGHYASRHNDTLTLRQGRSGIRCFRGILYVDKSGTMHGPICHVETPTSENWEQHNQRLLVVMRQLEMGIGPALTHDAKEAA